jgi:hypothetical protein
MTDPIIDDDHFDSALWSAIEPLLDRVIKELIHSEGDDYLNKSVEEQLIIAQLAFYKELTRWIYFKNVQYQNKLWKIQNEKSI